MTEAGLAPGMAGADFLRYVPAVRQLCQVDPIQVCNIDSTDMTPNHWLAIARAVEEHYDDYDGFVICHGTDTMAYTAAALSYLIQGSPKPIVLTGSQKPIHMEITDSKTNLLDSFTVACDGRLPGVTVVFGGRIIPGTRARKTYSKSFGAFSSINHPILGVVQEGKVTPYILPEGAPRPAFFHRLDQAVSLVKLVPGQSPDYLAFALEHSHGVLVESFGVGGRPRRPGGGLLPLDPAGGRPGQDGGLYYPGAERGQRPGGLPGGPRPQNRPGGAGGPRHDPGGGLRQAHVGPGPQPGPGRTGPAVLHPRGPGHSSGAGYGVVCAPQAVGGLPTSGRSAPGGPPTRRGPCFLYKKAGGKESQGSALHPDILRPLAARSLHLLGSCRSGAVVVFSAPIYGP